MSKKSNAAKKEVKTTATDLIDQLKEATVVAQPKVEKAKKTKVTVAKKPAPKIDKVKVVKQISTTGEAYLMYKKLNKNPDSKPSTERERQAKAQWRRVLAALKTESKELTLKLIYG